MGWWGKGEPSNQRKKSLIREGGYETYALFIIIKKR
jgi:hypothetical protein